MKNILITGACGFVGAHLTEELTQQKRKVVALDILTNSRNYFFSQKLDKKSTFIKSDVTDYQKILSIIKKYQIDCIFHLAAQPLVEEAYNDPRKTLITNIVGTINILEAARNYGKIKAVIVASSDKAYGKIKSKNTLIIATGGTIEENTSQDAKDSPLKYFTGVNRDRILKLRYQEFDPLSGDHPYEVSKSSADLISQSYGKTYGLPVVITRFGNIYGEGDLYFSRVIPGIMKALVKNEVFEIRSNGLYVRDYLYVKDVIRGYLTLADKGEVFKGEAFNFGSNDTHSVLSLIKLISQITKIPFKYKILNTARNEIPYQSLDYSKAKTTLGWQPKYSLKSTVKGIYKWYKNFFHFAKVS